MVAAATTFKTLALASQATILALTNQQRGEEFGKGLVLFLAFIAGLVFLVVYLVRKSGKKGK